jgi:hypothetical protein
VNQDLQSVSKDKHLGFRYDPERAAELIRIQSQNKEEAAKARDAQLASIRQDNFGFRKVEPLDGMLDTSYLITLLPPKSAAKRPLPLLPKSAACKKLFYVVVFADVRIKAINQTGHFSHFV